MAGPLNYTTTIPANRTVGEVQALLAEHGAEAIAITYTDRRPAGLRFQMDGNAFDLPVNVDGMAAALKKARKAGHVRSISEKIALSRDHAERVAWRVVKDWIEAQLALIDAQQVTLDEVMLPYLLVGDGRALRQQWREHLALPGGDS